MNAETCQVLPFKPRPAQAPRDTLQVLVGDLLALAKRLEAAGYASTAALLVGGAYGLCDDPEPDDGGWPAVA